MGQRYAELYDENGGVIDPAFFTQDMADFAGELDGGLDRDNFAANDIVSGDVNTSGGRVFNLMGTDYFYNTQTTYAPDKNITSWQGGTGNDASGVGYLQFTSLQDGHFDIHWSGYWFWDGAYSWVTAGARPDTTDTFDTLRLRVTVDGIPVCIAGPFEDGLQYGATYMCGAIQLPAGTHTVRVECEVVRRIAQSGELDGVCTNTVHIDERTLTCLGRIR
jgi:hypothetical protein